MLDFMTVLVDIINHHLHQRVEVALALIMGNDCFLRTVEGQTFALGTRTDLSNIVKTQHHIL